MNQLGDQASLEHWAARNGRLQEVRGWLEAKGPGPTVAEMTTVVTDRFGEYVLETARTSCPERVQNRPEAIIGTVKFSDPGVAGLVLDLDIAFGNTDQEGHDPRKLRPLVNRRSTTGAEEIAGVATRMYYYRRSRRRNGDGCSSRDEYRKHALQTISDALDGPDGDIQNDCIRVWVTISQQGSHLSWTSKAEADLRSGTVTPPAGYGQEGALARRAKTASGARTRSASASSAGGTGRRDHGGQGTGLRRLPSDGGQASALRKPAEDGFEPGDT